MDELTKDKIDFFIVFVREFALRYHLSHTEAWQYLHCFGGDKAFIQHYNYLHTQAFSSMVNDISIYCNRMGGTLI